MKKEDVKELDGFGENFIKTILINFDERYAKRIIRYYIRSLRRVKRRLR